MVVLLIILALLVAAGIGLGFVVKWLLILDGDRGAGLADHVLRGADPHTRLI